MNIEPLQVIDIDRLVELQPPGWNDIRKVFRQFINYHFFLPLKMEFEGKIIVVGEALLNKKSAWIGNIIVHPEFRNRGFGILMTNHLINELRAKGIQTQYLLATEQGKPLYEKLGFQHISKYVFLKNKTPKIINRKKNPELQSYQHNFKQEIYELDHVAMGEDRSGILPYFINESILFIENDQLQGFYLPNLGDGLIIASNLESGLSLTEQRILSGKDIITIPEENKQLIQWAESHGFVAYRWAYKMYTGKTLDWNPTMIYSRIGGYLG